LGHTSAVISFASSTMHSAFFAFSRNSWTEAEPSESRLKLCSVER